MRNILFLMLAPFLCAFDFAEPFWNGTFPKETPATKWKLQNAFPNLTFVDPVSLVEHPRYRGLLFVVSKPGKIFVIHRNTGASQKHLVLDISHQVQTHGDAGFVSLAFHPEFGIRGSKNRGFIYVFYQYTPNPKPAASISPKTATHYRLSRFWVNPRRLRADPNSEFVMIQQYDRHLWHGGGAIKFDKEGLMYLTVGDEGASHDSLKSTQRIDDRLFGGVLRLDVDCDPRRSHRIRRQPLATDKVPLTDQKSFTRGYCIPNKNPWQSPEGKWLEEFYAIGLRSPFSMHLDSRTQKIYVGDVGQERIEEINEIHPGANYQWPYREALFFGKQPKPADLIGHEVEPLFSYGRDLGAAVLIGPISRGTRYEGATDGKLLVADNISNHIWALSLGAADGVKKLTYLATNPRSGEKAGIGCIYESNDGVIYICDLNGTDKEGGIIRKLVKRDAPTVQPPALLSATGIFSDLKSLTPHSSLLPFEVTTPLWSDGALKQRWVAIPKQPVVFSPTGPWQFPEGTVFVKNFATPDKNIETRFLVRTGKQGVYGVTYRWRDDQSDAELLHEGMKDTESWEFPSREDCLRCHNPNTRGVLGVNARQLNREIEVDGVPINQLTLWSQLGIFNSPLSSKDISNIDKLASIHDTHASPELRVRSYLDANCSHCHRPGGAPTLFDARFTTPLEKQNLINGALVRDYSIEEAKVVVPGKPELSILFRRDKATGDLGMPPLAKAKIDFEYISVLREWIANLN